MQPYDRRRFLLQLVFFFYVALAFRNAKNL